MTLEKRGVDLERGTLKIFKGKSKAARRTLKLTVAAREIVARRMWESTFQRWMFPTPKTKTRDEVPISQLNGPFDKVSADRMAKGDEPALPDASFVLIRFAAHLCNTHGGTRYASDDAGGHLRHSSLRMVTWYVHPTQDHINAAITRIDELLRAERSSTNINVRNELDQLDKMILKQVHGERTFNNLGQRPTKNEKPH